MHLEWADIEEENMADGTSDTRQYALKRRALNSMNDRHSFGLKVKLNVKTKCPESLRSAIIQFTGAFRGINNKFSKCKHGTDALRIETLLEPCNAAFPPH